MRTRILLLVATGLLAMLLSGIAFADGLSAPGAVELSGQAQVDQIGRQQQLSLKADSADGAWHLEATLSPSIPSSSGRGSGGQGQSQQPAGRNTALNGNFTLTGPGGASTTGQATGQLNGQGSGTVEFTGDSGNVDVNASFSFATNGQLTMSLSGQLPATVAPVASAAPATAVAAPTINHFFWYLSRAAGFSAYLVLFLNMVFGIMVGTRAFDVLLARWRSFDLHQFTALLGLGLLGLHAMALLGDHYVGFSLGDILVPFTSSYRPFWVGTGIIGIYLLALITYSFYVRYSIGQRAWRIIHLSSFLAFVLALGHSVFSGTDSTQLWAQLLYLSTGLFVIGLTAWRFARGTNDSMESSALRSAA